MGRWCSPRTKTGFPTQQRPEELNLGSMIALIADTYDNLRRERPEQKALSMTETLNTMNQGAGKDFHPLLISSPLQPRSAIISISTIAPSGSAPTCNVLRAGGSEGKYSA